MAYQISSPVLKFSRLLLKNCIVPFKRFACKIHRICLSYINFFQKKFLERSKTLFVYPLYSTANFLSNNVTSSNFVSDEIVNSASSLLATKASVMFDTLQKHLPEGCFVGAFKDQTLRKPQGGFFLVVTLPEKVSATKLRDKAKNELDLVIFPGIESGDSLDNKFRLCFAYHSVEEIKAGVEKLCNCIQSFINSQNFQLS